MVFVRKYFLLLTLVPLLVLALAACFYRFIVLADYTVKYEVDCDPAQSSCFLGCNDEECLDTYNYSLITRDAQTLKSMCGRDITDCEASYFCTEEEEFCQEIFCNTNDSECAALETDAPLEEESNDNTYDL